MSLLTEPWIPVRCRDGSRKWISPDRIAEDGIVAFDANRPDFNGALAQFMIGLLQTVSKLENPRQWRGYFKAPPDTATLASWFEPLREVFAYEGEGARFMQDFSLRFAGEEALGVGGLLIEAPGGNTIKNNIDHFVERGRVGAMCPHCAVTALLTLQINAPSGGVGHRTGLRGGGPLTTLVVTEQGESLWHDLWLNVGEKKYFEAPGWEGETKARHHLFPWLADIAALQSEGGSIAPIQVHPLHLFWATPRRIRFEDADAAGGVCDVCGRHMEKLVKRYVTKNYGLNYKGAWDHPLSPYYRIKEEELPVHPQPGGFGYRHWLAWVADGQEGRRRANVITRALKDRSDEMGSQWRVWAFGYDMDNAKARCWYEAAFPLFELAHCDAETQSFIVTEAGKWIEAAGWALSLLRGAVKDAWFGADAGGDFSMIDASFWSGTEPNFYQRLRQLIEAAKAERDPAQERLDLARSWHEALIRAVVCLFEDEFVGAGLIERQHPRRVALAFKSLRSGLYGKKMLKILNLPEPETRPVKGRHEGKPDSRQ